MTVNSIASVIVQATMPSNRKIKLFRRIILVTWARRLATELPAKSMGD
jgi:hypothetical protein